MNSPLLETPVLTEIEEVGDLIDRVRGEAFDELAGRRIDLGTFTHKTAFFTSRPVISSLFVLWKPVRYKISVNSDIFEKEVPQSYVAGIMAHELAHTAWYVRKGRWATISLLRIFVSEKAHACFERATDVDAFIRGYGESIKAYRQHIYPGLTPEQLAHKARNYFSPEEIDVACDGLARFPELGPYWLKNPPLSLHEIRRDITLAEDGERHGGGDAEA